MSSRYYKDAMLALTDTNVDWYAVVQQIAVAHPSVVSRAYHAVKNGEAPLATNSEARDRVVSAYNKHNKVYAVKEARQAFDLSLKAAKEYVESSEIQSRLRLSD